MRTQCPFEIQFVRADSAQPANRTATWIPHDASTMAARNDGCACLASEDADHMHGTRLFVASGMTLYPGFETGG